MNSPAAPAPFGACPNAQQLLWQEMGMYAFLHFTVNTFTGREWGDGTEPEDVFNPTDLDCDQWCRVLAEAGFKGAVLTCKHHDGFCLWPSKYTEHSVKNSTWRDGKGDVVREFSDAARKYGLKVGFYLSPWDRHDSRYGTGEAYNEYFRNQLRELIENYGGEGGKDVFISWFDGAKGEGEKTQEYDYEGCVKIIRECAPNSAIMGHMGDFRDIRWCGNESGFAGNPNWATIDVYENSKLQNGDPNGKFYWPSEVDVSIRPGWYYHEREDDRVRSLESLIEIYYNSVGAGSCLNLNVPPDLRGRFHERDIERLQEWTSVLERAFRTDFAAGKHAASATVRDEGFSAQHMLDGDRQTYWAAPEGVTQCDAVIELGQTQNLNVFKLREYSELGERVAEFELYFRNATGGWELLAQDHTVSFRKLVRTKTVSTDAIKLAITSALAAPCIQEFGAYYQAPLLFAPKLSRSIDGTVTMETEPDLLIHYTTDGSQPTDTSALYTAPVTCPEAGTVRAIAVLKPGLTDEYAELKLSAPEAILRFGVERTAWQVTEADSEYDEGNLKENIALGKTWISARNTPYPHSFTIDTGKQQAISGIIYHVNWSPGIVQDYRVWVDGDVVHEGSFENILNNPIPQIVEFAAPVQGQHVKFEALAPARPGSCFASCSLLEVF
jgi:alpha-L-fucosidase